MVGVLAVGNCYGQIAVSDLNGKWGFVDEMGNLIIPYKYDYAWSFSEGLGRVKKDYYMGYVDKTGKIVIPLRYWGAWNFSEGLAVVEQDLKWGFIDKTGKVVIPFQYDSPSSFNDGLAMVLKNDKRGFIDKTGKVVIPLQYEYVGDFSDGLAKVRKNWKWGYIDKNGKVVIPLQYKDASNFSEGLAVVEQDQKWGYIDKNGEVVIPFQYDYATKKFNEGLAVVKQDQKWGFIDKTGKVVVPLQYEDANIFREGLASVKQNGKYGFIDKTGKVVIPLQYEDASVFREGLVGVKQNGKYGFVDKTGKVVIPLQYDCVKAFSGSLAQVERNGIQIYVDIYGNEYMLKADAIRGVQEASRFSKYAQRYVEERVNEWQKKGKYEKTATWKARVNETTRNEKIKELTAEAEMKFIAEKSKDKELSYSLGDYDADNEVYLVKCDEKDILVPVPIDDAETFYNQWSRIEKTPRYFIENDKIAVAEVDFTMPSGKVYKYSNTASVNYTIANVDYNFEPIEIETPTTTTKPKGKQTIATVDVAIGKSEVDTDIPVTTMVADNTFAVVIGNENYRSVAKVAFAGNDADVFAKYCEKTLGLPKNHISVYKDATFGVFLEAIEGIKQITKAYNGDLNVIFYYAGHGIPNETDKSAYLLPIDANGTQTRVCLGVDQLYKELGGLGAKSVLVFLDACFSGAQRGGGMLANKRGVALKPREAEPQGNMVVFSATDSDQTADSYDEMGHGMFTYYLLDKLRSSKGDVTLKELGDHIITNVSRQSVVVNKSPQTPIVTPSATMAGWETMKMR